MQRLRKAWWLVLLSGFVACASSSVFRYADAPRYEPIPASEVTVYNSFGEIETEYEKIAEIEAEGKLWFDAEDRMLSKMKEEAAKVGANGLVLRGIDTQSLGEAMASEQWKKGQAIAVKVHPKTDQPED